MTDEQIKEIALANGFKLKEQPNGDVGLNPYVYDFARALIDEHEHYAKTDSISNIANWFKEAKPEPTDDDVIAQMACHFEEVDEMIDSTNIHPFTNHLYQIRDNCKQIRDNNLSSDCIAKGDNLELLDALADQIVTAVGVAYMMGFDIIGALEEVNASNWSKFVDGKAVTDENGKIMKGSEYFPPDLTKFV